MSGSFIDTLTYSLSDSSGGTETYYADVAAFTDEVLAKLHTEQAVGKFSRYLALRKLEPFAPDVCALEYLMIGVLWKVYGDRAVAGSVFTGRLLSSIYGQKGRGAGVRKAVDRLKGIAGTAILARHRRPQEQIRLHDFSRLIGWLQASGEFEQECKRLKLWLDFMKGLPGGESDSMLVKAVKKAIWFEHESVERLGSYTTSVDSYIESNQQRLKWQENRIFCSRARVEYHLNMVGAEIMNRVFHDDFQAAKDKMVFLPVCMRNKSAEACRAVQEGTGYACKGCSVNCRVNAATKMAAAYGCKVLMIPHASTAFGRERNQKGEVGIVGVACVLNLISGGYKAKEMGYEPQCVLLHHSGCMQHWHPEGIETCIDLERLERILREGGKIN